MFSMTGYFDLWRFLAGVGVFLFAMRQIETSLKHLAGREFKRFLRRTTRNSVLSVVSGILTTVVVQSSSLVGLIVLALVGAELIPLMNGIGVVLGANLGTTVIGWIVATIGFKLELEKAVLPMLAVGSLGLSVLQGRAQTLCRFLFGMSLLLTGLSLMKESVATLSDCFDVEALDGYPVVVFLLVGMLFTAIIQSSSATMMIVLSALDAGIVSLPAAAALVIGADLGTTSTVLMGGMQGVVSKRRVAMAHFLFNLAVDTMAFAALYPLLALLRQLSITDSLYSLVAFHSLFNLFGIILFIPALPAFTRFLEAWIKDDKQTVCHYIANVPVNVTDVALEALAKECLHLIYNVAVLNMRFLSIPPSEISYGKAGLNHLQLSPGMDNQDKLAQYKAIKILEGKVVSYSVEMQTQALDTQAASTIELLLDSVRHAVFSSKCLKDIGQDLEYFIEHDNPVIAEKFNSQQRMVKTFYKRLFLLFEHRHNSELFAEELEAIAASIEQFYRSYSSDLYAGVSHDRLNHLDISTLLNVNKEINTSCKAFYKAVNRFWVRISIQDY